MRLRTSFVALFPALFAVTAAFGQANLGRISGTVTDASGGAIGGAKVTIINTGTGLKRNFTTESSGFYLVPNLPVGIYNVDVESSGFRKAEKTGLDLPDDGRLTADFNLQIGTLTESVEVSAVAGETVNTVSGELSRVINSEPVENLALNGRNYMEL